MNATDLTIRRATRADAAGIALMSREEIERGLGWSWTEARVVRAIGSRETNVIVAETAGELLGFGIMMYADEHAHLSLFAVARGQRRRGVGRGILDWLETVARDAGLLSIRVECRRTNDAARNFYGEQGYQEIAISRGYYQRVEDAVILEKHLRSPDPEAGSR